ncbi:MAG: class I SAM-dependent methyltransferase [Anaerolineae bacterium]|nr:class I SAM-dependent methyltransferase [Anaerolineae bacterium]
MSTPMTAPTEAPLDEYGEGYFKSYNYADRPLGRFSMYWFARRYYARLVGRFAPRRPVTGRLLELGSGLGHLLGLLSDQFTCVGADIAHYAAQETRRNARGAAALVASADRLDVFADRSFDVVVALHLVEHLIDPRRSLEHIHRILAEGGLLLMATPNPVYALRPLKHIERTPDAISKDPTHINVQPPEVWHRWAEENGLRVLRHFGDGLWDVPYLPFIPSSIQFAVFGLPSLVQVLSGLALIPTSMGVNQIIIARKEC